MVEGTHSTTPSIKYTTKWWDNTSPSICTLSHPMTFLLIRGNVNRGHSDTFRIFRKEGVRDIATRVGLSMRMVAENS